MTNRLILHFKSSTITIDSDNVANLNILSDFCKNELGAYYTTENIEELTVDDLSEEMYEKFHSLLFELGLL